jgi:hypothetical protein
LDISELDNEILSLERGDTREEKLKNLLLSYLKDRLQDCSEAIVEFETQFGLTFREFQQAYENEELGDPYSHKLESTYLEWEGLEDERNELRALIKKIKKSSPSELSAA